MVGRNVSEEVSSNGKWARAYSIGLFSESCHQQDVEVSYRHTNCGKNVAFNYNSSESYKKPSNHITLYFNRVMRKEYKINRHNSTVCGYPGRNFDWSKFDWVGKSIFKSMFKGIKDMKAPKPWVDGGFIAENCQYLHIPYDFEEQGTIYRVRPNPTMEAGKIYRGRQIIKQTAVKRKGIWYWVLESDIELEV